MRDLSPGHLNVLPDSYYQDSYYQEWRGLAADKFLFLLVYKSGYPNVSLMFLRAFYLSMLFTKKAIEMSVFPIEGGDFYCCCDMCNLGLPSALQFYLT